MNYLIVDGNSLGHAAHDMPVLTVDNRQVQAVFGTLKKLRAILKEFPGYKPVFLWDGHAKWRYDLFPLYKDRDSDEEKAAVRAAYKEQIPFIQQALEHLGVLQITVSNAEADDIAAWLSRKLKANKVNKIKLVTGDMDWCQLVDDNVEWYCPVVSREKRHCSLANFEEFTGFANQKLFIEAKCLGGDTSDNIPGVGGIGKKSIPSFLEKYGSVVSFMKASKEGSLPEKLPAALRRLAKNEAPKDSAKYGKMPGAFSAYIRNRKLMNLVNDWKPEKEMMKQVKGRFDIDKFEAFCEDMMFKSIVVQMNTWAATFRNVA